MLEITFIFKFNNEKNNKYGKILLRYLSDNHEGVDNEIKDIVENAINLYMTANLLSNINNLKIGIIGIIDGNLYSSDNEISIYDLYIDCTNKEYKKHIYYYNNEKGFLNESIKQSFVGK